MKTINLDDEMSLHSCKLLVVLASVLLLPATALIAADTDTTATDAVDWYDPAADPLDLHLNDLLGLLKRVLSEQDLLFIEAFSDVCCWAGKGDNFQPFTGKY